MVPAITLASLRAGTTSETNGRSRAAGGLGRAAARVRQRASQDPAPRHASQAT